MGLRTFHFLPAQKGVDEPRYGIKPGGLAHNKDPIYCTLGGAKIGRNQCIEKIMP